MVVEERGGEPVKKLLCLLRHDWSQWSAAKDEEHIVTYNPQSFAARSYIRTVRLQGRSCFRCGAIQERVIREIGERPALLPTVQ